MVESANSRGVKRAWILARLPHEKSVSPQTHFSFPRSLHYETFRSKTALWCDLKLQKYGLFSGPLIIPWLIYRKPFLSLPLYVDGTQKESLLERETVVELES